MISSPSALPARLSGEDLEATGDAYGRYRYMRNEDRTRDNQSRRPRRSGDTRLEIQNVRGFTKDSRQKWLQAWRRTPLHDRPLAWLIQETHVKSVEEAEDLQQTWRELWGRKHQRNSPVLSFWSVHDARQGGVAILLNPSAAGKVQPWKQARWTNRVMAITIGELLVINVYAPNDHRDREAFFTQLQAWPRQQQDTILAGDFNCVQGPLLDRLGGHRSKRPESKALEQLLEQGQLEDARILEEHAETEEVEDQDPTEFFTYWGPEAASRIDRYYVPKTWTAVVERVEVEEPAIASDHQRVTLHMREANPAHRKRRRKTGVSYPIKTANPDRVQKEVLAALSDRGVGHEETAKTWDETTAICGECIKQVAQQDQARRKAVIGVLNAQHRAHLLNRKDLLAVTEEDIREAHLVRLGQRLERTMDHMRWEFKRVSNWEKDQTISAIKQMHGEKFRREMNIASKFGSEWKPVLGTAHNAFHGMALEVEFDKFVTIPNERRLTPADNRHLMQEITQEEVILAIRSLNRHRAAGPDGLNNDFFKDYQALLVPAMVAIGNELLKGGDPPPSFLEGLIIPLRKKGDSDDAMDFRPISLLQTDYKVYTKVIATRVQRVLGKPIGESQQGFVHGRQMLKTVMMMLAVLATAAAKPEVAAAFSELILLLDFRKAYDTVARDFLFLTLIKFGFSPEFVAMIQRIHVGTTARFLVNGELSDPLQVKSGIRQGCPLAPLLFLLAAEVLALAIQQDQDLVGITVPGSAGSKHKFSAFVDDSTVFLSQAQQLPRVMEIVEWFGKLSGLQVQPAKSCAIFLNTAIDMRKYHGIPVLKHGDTIRYLGYAVGTGPLTDINWATRIRAVQRRLATASQLSTSVEFRVLMLNVIMLPAILFTAAAFDMPHWVNTQIMNIQKQFLWHHSTAAEASRHKVSPALLYTPKQAGGVGLASVQVACKTQRVKHTLLWMLQKKDIYHAAWKSWVFRGADVPSSGGITPRQVQRRQNRRTMNQPGRVLMQTMGEWIRPAVSRTEAELNQYKADLQDLARRAISWTTTEEWVVELSRPLPRSTGIWSPEEERFWPTYSWADNPWILDAKGKTLTGKVYDKIRRCSLAELEIQRIGRWTYSFVIPEANGGMHQQAKLRRWAIAILLSSPPIEIGKGLQVNAEMQLRHQPKLEHTYRWECTAPGRAKGVRLDQPDQTMTAMEVAQIANGIHWTVVETGAKDNAAAADRTKLRRFQDAGSIVFYAHPRVHSIQWSVPDNIANKHVLTALKQQPFRRCKEAQAGLAAQIDKLHGLARSSPWQAATLHQTPKKLWTHGRELTAYQVWVSYRVATAQLNLYHSGRQYDNSCCKLQACKGTKETLVHVMWGCPCAQACWQKLLSNWTGKHWTGKDIERFITNCASRTAPALAQGIADRFNHEHPDDAQQYVAIWKRIWHILCSVCITTLWIQRNRVVFNQEEVTEESSVQEFWTTGMRQLTALAKRERRNPDTVIQGPVSTRRTTTRAVSKDDKPRTTTGSPGDTGVANQA